MISKLPLFLLLPLVANASTPQDEIAGKVPAARAILDGWQARNPEKSQRKLHIVLWTPSDRDPAPHYKERLTAILNDIRDFYAREMTRIGFGPRTLHFDHSEDGLIRIHLVKGLKPYADYQVDSGGEIRQECLPQLRAEGVDADKETIVIFCNMSNWDKEKSTISQNSPYYAGGNSRGGTAWQVDSPILNLDSLTKNEPRVLDGQYGRISIGKYNTIFIGGACHELGHSLGLPHNRERPDERAAFGTALMGSGNSKYGDERRGEGKGAFLTLAHALRLASHPIFSGSVKGMDLPASAVPTDLAIRQNGKGFSFSGKVTATPPVYAVVAYTDPEGGSDYDATTATAIPDKDGNFTLDCQALTAGKKGELRVIFLQANGQASGFLNPTPYRYPYTVDKDGKADISMVGTRLILQPLVAAVNAGNEPLVASILATPDIAGDPRIAEIAARFAATVKARKDGPVNEDTRSIPLSDLAASEERTGYGKPLRDRLPRTDGLLASGNHVFAHGLYAHAPARHVWPLDGTWKSLTGKAGLADGFDGSVKFIIEGDGRILWESETVKSGQLPQFQVNLTGVTQLTLRTEDNGDSNRGDWALWLEPVLSR